MRSRRRNGRDGNRSRRDPAPSRLDRDLGRKRHGDERYAREELVAELGAAFLAADLELYLGPREDRAGYIAHWFELWRGADNVKERGRTRAIRAVTASRTFALFPDGPSGGTKIGSPQVFYLNSIGGLN